MCTVGCSVVSSCTMCPLHMQNVPCSIVETRCLVSEPRIVVAALRWLMLLVRLAPRCPLNFKGNTKHEVQWHPLLLCIYTVSHRCVVVQHHPQIQALRCEVGIFSRAPSICHIPLARMAASQNMSLLTCVEGACAEMDIAMHPHNATVCSCSCPATPRPPPEHQREQHVFSSVSPHRLPKSSQWLLPALYVVASSGASQTHNS